MMNILQLDIVMIFTMFVFWISLMVFDLLLTMKNKKFIKNYENSFILSFFVKKTRLSCAVILTILSEIALVFVPSFIFVHKFDIEITALTGLFFGLVHIMGLHTTRKFIKNHSV